MATKSVAIMIMIEVTRGLLLSFFHTTQLPVYSRVAMATKSDDIVIMIEVAPFTVCLSRAVLPWRQRVHRDHD